MVKQVLRFGGAALAAGVLLAAGLAGYGIWSRGHAVTALQARADDASVPRVEAVSPKRAAADSALTLPGQVSAWNEAQIYGQVSGYIAHWHADYGAHVKAGDVLATIDTPSLDAQYEASQAQLKVAQADADIAELTAKRFDALKGTGYETQQDIDNKDAAALAGKARVAAAQQNVDNYRAKEGFKDIKAPFDGVVTARRVNVGDFIGANGADDTRGSSNGQAPYAIGDVSRLRVFVSVPQSLAAVLKPGLAAELHPLSDPAEAIPAKFLTMAGAVQTATRTIVTEFAVDDAAASGLMPGAYVDVAMTYPGDPNLLTVPSQALLFRAEGPQVALVDGDGRVRLRGVTLGHDLGLTVQVTAGLARTDRIVANPSLGLLDGERVEVVKAVAGYEPGSAAAPPAAPSSAAAAPKADQQAAGGAGR